MKKQILFSISMILMVVGIMSLAYAELNYEPEILEEFNKSSEVAVIVKLYSQNMTKVDEVLATLSETEFKLEGKFPNGRGFYGNITKEGFDKLIKNSDVKMIYLERISYIAQNATVCGDGVCEVGENCENCIVDCECVGQEECVDGECKVKEAAYSTKLMLLWMIIAIIVIVAIPTFQYLKRREVKW